VIGSLADNVGRAQGQAQTALPKTLGCGNSAGIIQRHAHSEFLS